MPLPPGAPLELSRDDRPATVAVVEKTRVCGVSSRKRLLVLEATVSVSEEGP